MSLRFRTKQRPKGLLRARDQRRLTLMVLAIGLVLFAFQVVGRPGFWKWMFPEQQPAVEADTDQLLEEIVTPDDESKSRPTDTTDPLQPDKDLRPDEFLTEDNSATNDSVGMHTVLRPQFAEGEPPTDESGLPRLPDELLKQIKDDVIGVHSSESEAWFAALKLASRIEQRKQLKVRRGAYALFQDAPDDARGRPWRIRGRLRRLSFVSSPPNSYGIGTVYDAWISTPDSGNELVHVVTTAVDKSLAALLDRVKTNTIDFSVKDSPEVTCVAYFFKREGYASKNAAGISVAPLLLGGTLRQIPQQEQTSSMADQLTPYLGWLALIVCAGIALMVWSFTTSDQQAAGTRAHQLTQLPATAPLEGVEFVSVEESLKQLAPDTKQQDSSDLPDVTDESPELP